MSNVNDESQTDPQQMQKEIQDLNTKYDNLSKEVIQLESNKATLSADLKEIHGEFEQINQSIEEILLKLNKISDEYIEMGSEMDEENSISHHMKRFFNHPIRKIAVGTLSAIYTVADKTMEKTSNFKESLEDIVAEAQYSNKKKKMATVENS